MWPEIEKANTENRHELVLSGKEISKRIDKQGLDLSIFSLIGLNYLNISESNLTHVPDEIEQLSNLQTLVLYSNKIEEINDKIGRLEKLKILDLSRNAIKVIPNSFAKLPLVTMNLNGNKLETLPDLTINNKLTVLDVSNNKLKEFPKVCTKELVNLLELRLNGNEIEEIPNNINVLPSLKLIELGSNKIKLLPGELADCQKLKDIGLKSNPIVDRRLLKLIDQCRTKQVIDYVKQHCPRTSTNVENASKKGTNQKKKTNSESDEESSSDYKYRINIKYADEDFKIIILNTVKSVREHLLACIVNNVKFTEESFKKFIQLQNKLHDTVCEKRNSATIATHDFNKLPLGDLTYTTALPDHLMIKPLGRSVEMTGAELFSRLQTEANNLRKEKKRNTYSGIHKYLYLIEGKQQYPCLLNEKKEVISFPPITNSDISKIEIGTTKMIIEVTSSISQYSCKKVLDTLLKDMVLLFGTDLEVQQVRTTDIDAQLKAVYPSKTDLKFENSVPIKVVRS